MGALLSALDALAADDLDTLPAGAQLDRIRSLVAARNRIDAELTRAVRAADLAQAVEHDGLKSITSWLRTHTRLSDAAARRLIEAGRALQALPAVQQSFAAGAISAEAVTAIAPVATPHRLTRAADQNIDMPEIARVLAQLATEVPHPRLREAVAFYLRHLDPDGTEPDPTEGRSLTMSRLLGGTYSGTFALDPVGGEKVATAIESIAAASRCAGDTRTAAQMRGDALVQLCDLALASGQLPILRTVKPHIGVLIGIEDLVDPAPGTTRPPPASAPRSPPPAPAGSPATPPSAGSSSAPTRCPSTWAATSGSPHPTCAAPSSSATRPACSPAARPPPGGARSTTSCTGATAATPAWTTRPCSANATTARSTTASPSSETPTADGTPTAPTAPRSSSTRSSSERASPPA